MMKKAVSWKFGAEEKRLKKTLEQQWCAFEAQKETEIDYSEIPELDNNFFIEERSRISMTKGEIMTALARSFPTFGPNGVKRNQAGIDPWNPELLHRTCGGMSSGEKQVVFFLLSVWNPEWDMDSLDDDGNPIDRHPVFNVHNAMGIWDAEHRNAFIAWAKSPWWM